MKTRIIAAAVLLPLLLLVLLAAPTIVATILCSAVCAIAAYELLRGTGLVRQPRLLIYSMLFAAAVPFWSWFGCNTAIAEAGILVFFCLLFMELMISRMKLPVEKMAMCVFGGVLAPYLISSLIRLMIQPGGRALILLPFVISFLADSGAYFVGCAIGKHKMAPVISPQKSWEGFFGGIVTAILGMLLFVLILQLGFGFRVNYLYAAVYGLIGALAGAFGDLCFSAIKRQTGIKDYGNLIPGHGGIMDRFDSIIVVAPLVEVLLHWIPVVVK